jgi:hypothetical protein
VIPTRHYFNYYYYWRYCKSLGTQKQRVRQDVLGRFRRLAKKLHHLAFADQQAMLFAA